MAHEVREPFDVDSLGKLNEWLAECGMPQRDTKLAIERQDNGDDIAVLDPAMAYEVWALGFAFDREDRDAANAGYRNLISYVAGGLYARFSDPRLNEVVWRIRPELDEHMIFGYLDPAGNEVDPIVYPGDANELRMIDTGTNNVRFYCRLGFRIW